MGIINTQAGATDSFFPWNKHSPFILSQLMNSITQPPTNTRGRGSCDPGYKKKKLGLGRGMDGWHGVVRGAFYSVGGTHTSLVAIDLKRNQEDSGNTCISGLCG